MGCRLTKDENKFGSKIVETISDSPAPEMQSKTEYKSRFERKMCLAKETPEADFDLSDCNLKEIPTGVFAYCQVLRKETLNLSQNQLSMFVDNLNLLNNLPLLRVLNLSYNRIRKLPDEIYKLESLRELLISNNQLEKLPHTIDQLTYLEHLDVSHNNLQSISEIRCMPNLQILNISGNCRLDKLPDTLGTCDKLCDLKFDHETVEWPKQEVLAAGTASIIKSLGTGETAVEIVDGNMSRPKLPEDALIDKVTQHTKLNQMNISKINCFDISGYGNENAILMEIQRKQQQQKEELLKEVLLQQNQTENLVNKIQQQKDNERHLLIKDILNAEENSNLIIYNFLVAKNKADNELREKEMLEEQRLLEKLHLEHSDLRKQEILSTMMETLRKEECKLLSYQEARNATSLTILEQENYALTQLGEFYRNYEKCRNDVKGKICEDEELQKQAVVMLMAQNDARSWGLVEQLRIVENQLASMTQFEIERKKYFNAEQTKELANRRLHLTYILTDLLEQQENRRAKLYGTLKSMEAQKSNEHQDYWLLQYQRLWDSRPVDFLTKAANIDPLLGYNFLLNGVIHCLPFLQKLLLDSEVFLESITERELAEAGVRDERDRQLILQSIKEYIQQNYFGEIECNPYPSAPEAEEAQESQDIEIDASTSQGSFKTIDRSSDSVVLANSSECVICMEEYVRIIFLPCGHMCCCFDCQQKVEICPMCRSEIERKVKVVQP